MSYHRKNARTDRHARACARGLSGRVVRRLTALGLVGALAVAVLSSAVSCSTFKGVGKDIGSATDLVRRGDSDTALSYRDQPEIRVRVHKGTDAAKFDGSPKFVLRTVGGGKTEIVPGPLVASSGPQGLTFVDGLQRVHVIGSGLDAEVVAYDGRAGESVLASPSPSASKASTPTLKDGTATRGDLSGAGSVLGLPTMKIDGVTYPGFATVRGRSSEGPDKLDVIVAMPIEDYLPGVVSHEMFPRWSQRAYEVQAVCSRSYALHERDRSRRAGKTFDVDSNESDQVYGGSALQGSIQNAVKNTRGVVLTSRGEVLRAYFSSTCGGHANSASAVWPTDSGSDFNNAAPLQGKRRDIYCEPSSWYRWQSTRSDEDLSQRIRAWGRTAGKPVKTMTRVRSIEVKDKNEAERATVYTLIDDRGTKYTLSAEDLRNACNAPVDTLPALTRATKVHSGDMQVEVRSGLVNIRGRGLGHGVGMCQWCAKGMGDQNMKLETILMKFYPGAKVQKLY